MSKNQIRFMYSLPFLTLVASLLLIILLSATPSNTSSSSVQVKVKDFETLKDWIKITMQISSSLDTTLQIPHNEISLQIENGIKINDWSFLDFFSGATMDMKKGESIQSKGFDLGNGNIVWRSYLDLQKGRVATITLELKSNTPQEAILLFPTKGIVKPTKLIFSNIGSANIIRK